MFKFQLPRQNFAWHLSAGQLSENDNLVRKTHCQLPTAKDKETPGSSQQNIFPQIVGTRTLSLLSQQTVFSN